MQKNWEGVTEKIEGKLYKWKWLLPQMSFKGRVLVLNNLVATVAPFNLCRPTSKPTSTTTAVASCILRHADYLGLDAALFFN